MDVGGLFFDIEAVRRPRCSAQAIVVPRTRFAPVKKCNDLLLLRSDAYACVNSVPVLAEGVSAAPSVSLDSKKYKLVQQLEANLIVKNLDGFVVQCIIVSYYICNYCKFE